MRPIKAPRSQGFASTNKILLLPIVGPSNPLRRLVLENVDVFGRFTNITEESVHTWWEAVLTNVTEECVLSLGSDLEDFYTLWCGVLPALSDTPRLPSHLHLDATTQGSV